MRKVILILLFIFLSFSVSEAARATWTQAMTNTDGTPMTDLAGWNLYEITVGRVKVNSALIPPSSCTGTNPLSCSWILPVGVAVDRDRFVITCVDSSANESADSNIATYDIRPSAPSSLKILE